MYFQQIHIRFKAAMLRSHSCNYSNVYFVVKGRISAKATKDKNSKNKNLTFKSNVTFRSFI